MQRALFAAVFVGWSWVAGAMAQTPASNTNPVDAYLSSKTNSVVVINLNGLFSSTLLRQSIVILAENYGDMAVKTVLDLADAFGGAADEAQMKQVKDALPMLKDVLKDGKQVGDFLDMLKQGIEEVIVAGTTDGDEPDFLVAIRSKFISPNTAEMVAVMAEASTQGQFKLKKDKQDGAMFYELAIPNTEDQTIHAAVPDRGLLLFGKSKESLQAAVKQGKAKENKLSADMRQLLASRQPGQTVYVAVMEGSGDEATKTSGHLTLDADFSVNFTVAAAKEDVAEAKATEFNEGLSSLTGFLESFIEDKPEFKSLGAALKKVKAVHDGKSVNVDFKLAGSDLTKALKEAKPDK